MHQFQQKPALIPRCHKAGQRCRDNHRITGNNVLCGIANCRGGPCHGHHPDRAVERRPDDLDLCPPVGANRNRPTEKRHQLFGGRWRLHLHGRGGITTRPDTAKRPVYPVDQPPVNVTHFDTQTALTEIMPIRIGRFKSGEVQNTHVNRRQRDIGHLALGHAIYQNRRPHRACLTIDNQRRVKADSQLFVTGANGGMGQAQRPAGVLACRCIHTA